MTAYIQVLNDIPHSDWGFTAYCGFQRRGIPIVLFEEIEEVPKRKDSIVVAFIEDTEKHFKRLGINVPAPLNIPAQLLPYAKRQLKIMTMAEFREDKTLPIFVKPNDKLKLFTSGVITRPSSKDFFHDIIGDARVLTSEVLDIVAEYRGFVVDGVLKSLNYYAGDFRYYPEDVRVIDQAVKDYTQAPAGYTIDFGVTATGETVLIECNDGWSVGAYGCDPDIYTQMLIRRWIQLTK